MGLPANAVLVHFPVRAVLAVEDVVGVVDVLLQLAGHLPLSVVALRGRGGDEASGCHLFGISEDLLAPPLEFSVGGWRKAADEGTCFVLLSAVMRGLDWRLGNMRTDLRVVALHAHGHVLESRVGLLIKLGHSRGDAASHEPVAGAQVLDPTALSAPLQELGCESTSAENGVGCGDDVSHGGLDAGALALVVELQRSHVGDHVLDTQPQALASDGSQHISCSDPTARLVDQHLLDAIVVSVLEKAVVELPRLRHRHSLQVGGAAELLVVVDDILSVIGAAHPVDTGLVEVRLVQRVALENVLSLESHLAVDYVVVVGADDFVPVP